MWTQRMREKGTVKRAEGKIGELVGSTARVNHKCPLGTMQGFKEPLVLYASML